MGRLVVKKFTAADEDEGVPAEIIRRDMQRGAEILAALERARLDRADEVPTMDAVTSEAWNDWATDRIWKSLEVYTEQVLTALLDDALDKVYVDINKAIKQRDNAINHLRKEWRKEIDLLISTRDLILTAEQMRQRLQTLRDEMRRDIGDEE